MPRFLRPLLVRGDALKESEKQKQRNRIKIRLAVRRGTFFKPQPSGRSLRDYAAEKKRYHHPDVLKVASFRPVRGPFSAAPTPIFANTVLSTTHVCSIF